MLNRKKVTDKSIRRQIDNLQPALSTPQIRHVIVESSTPELHCFGQFDPPLWLRGCLGRLYEAQAVGEAAVILDR
jgi:hypothetical protein